MTTTTYGFARRFPRVWLRSYLIALAVLFLSTASQAAIYKCLSNGVTAVQDTPCPAGSVETGGPPREPQPYHSAIEPAPAWPSSPPRYETADEFMQANWSSDEDLRELLLADKLQGAKRLGAPPVDVASACVERYRSSYRDPKSVYLVGATLMENENERFVYVDVSARNGFGGAGRSQLICSVPAP